MAGSGSGDGEKQVVLGRITGVHGVKGEVKIHAFTEDPDGIAAYGPLSLRPKGGTVEITALRLSGKKLVARLAGVADRNAAELLKGQELCIARTLLGETEGEDEFFLVDLMGLDARDPDGAKIGRVKAVFNYGAGDLLEIADADGQTELIPFLRDVVPVVDIAGGYLVVDKPEELAVEEEEQN